MWEWLRLKCGSGTFKLITLFNAFRYLCIVISKSKELFYASVKATNYIRCYPNTRIKINILFNKSYTNRLSIKDC